MMVARADRMAEQRNPRGAARQYRRVVQLFPYTPWAVVARDRLSKLENG